MAGYIPMNFARLTEEQWRQALVEMEDNPLWKKVSEENKEKFRAARNKHKEDNKHLSEAPLSRPVGAVSKVTDRNEGVTISETRRRVEVLMWNKTHSIDAKSDADSRQDGLAFIPGMTVGNTELRVGGMLDTGADMSCISREQAEDLMRKGAGKIFSRGIDIYMNVATEGETEEGQKSTDDLIFQAKYKGREYLGETPDRTIIEGKVMEAEVTMRIPIVPRLGNTGTFIVGGVLLDSLEAGITRHKQKVVISTPGGCSMVMNTMNLLDINEYLSEGKGLGKANAAGMAKAVYQNMVGKGRLNQEDIGTAATRLQPGVNYVHIMGGRKVHEDSISMVTEVVRPFGNTEGIPQVVTAGGDKIAAITVLPGGIQKGRPGIWIDNRTAEIIHLQAGVVRLKVTPVFEMPQITKLALQGEETEADLIKAGIRLPRAVTEKDEYDKGVANSRSVHNISREGHYPKQLIKELEPIFDLIPPDLQDQTRSVVDRYYTNEHSQQNQYDLLDKLQIEERPEGMDAAPWEPSEKEASKPVHHTSRRTKKEAPPSVEQDTGPIPDITKRSVEEQRWIHKVVRTVGELSQEEGSHTAKTQAQVQQVQRRLREQKKQQSQIIKTVAAVRGKTQRRPMQVQREGAGMIGAEASKIGAETSMEICARTNRNFEVKYRRVKAVLGRAYDRAVNFNTITERPVSSGSWEYSNERETWEDIRRRAEEKADSKGGSRA
jgi:hypothetical protein